MGFHVSLFVVQDKDAQAFLRALGLDETTQCDPENEARFSLVRLEDDDQDQNGPHQNGQHPNGMGKRWIVWMNWHDGMPEETDFARVSETAPFLNLDIAESSAMAVCRQWRAGAEEWALAHDGAQDGGLDIKGSLPPQAAAIIAASQAAQAAETAAVDHLFDAPVTLFEALGGIRHDAIHGLPFREARPRQTAPSDTPRAWWRFW